MGRINLSLAKIYIKNHREFLLFLVLLSLISAYLTTLSPTPPQTNFIDQANAFLHGKLYLLDPVRVWNDYAQKDGHYFIYFGLLPSLIYLPLVAIFGVGFPQQIIFPFIILSTFILIYKICIKLAASVSIALWLSTSIIFGSIYLILAITTISSYNVQVIGFLFILLSLWLFLKNSHPLLIALCVAAAGLTQPTYFLAGIFFILEWLMEKVSFQVKLIKQLIFINILLISFWVLGAYNYFRFDSPFETGYNFEQTTTTSFVKAKSYGIFSPAHLPGNFYILLFKAPDPIHADDISFVLKFPYIRADEWGMGIFFTSPILLYLILLRRKDQYTVSSIITIVALLIPVLLYYGVGRWQYGYRYAIVIYPFLIVLLASVFKQLQKIPFMAKFLILYGIIFNFLFMYSIWNVYIFPSLIK